MVGALHALQTITWEIEEVGFEPHARVGLTPKIRTTPSAKN
jgi:hypothetical protein